MIYDHNPIIMEAYFSMEKNLADIVRNREIGYQIIWTNIMVLIADSGVQHQDDCLGTLMYRLTEENEGVHDIYYSVRDNLVEYQQLKRVYGFGKDLSSWGSFWRTLIQEEKRFRLMRVYGVLHELENVILPYCKEKICEWIEIEETDNTCNPKTVEKAFRKSCSVIRKMKETLLIVCEVLELIEHVENDR